jgi:spore coat polysaccharide biosynthesis protein SpsF (cytidylyltransferase family)/GNAT superfamily N-acetyltransferase
MSRVVALVQARMGSTRLPGKVMADLDGRPLIDWMLERAGRAASLDAVWLATSDRAENEPLVRHVAERGNHVFRGDENDVLGRFTAAAREAGADVIVRLTADCPLIDPGVIDAAVRLFASGGFDYLSNAMQRSYPDGLDVEVFSRGALDRADREATSPFHREHVTPYLRTGFLPGVSTGDFNVGHLLAPADFGHLRWTVDTPEDLARVRAMVRLLPADFGWMDVLALLTRRPELLGQAVEQRKPVRLRPAVKADCRLLLDWVNSPSSLANKLATAAPILPAEHEAWLNGKLGNPHAMIWIGEAEGRPAGQVRLDRNGDALDVDIYVDPVYRGQGVGLAMLEAAHGEAAFRWPGLPLRARIKPGNWPSRRLFARAGFGHMIAAADHIILHLHPAAPRPGKTEAA